MDNYRFYIQHRHNYDSFVSKLNVSSGQSTYVSLDRYVPNISKYPLSFTSLDSVADFIHNQFTMEYGDYPRPQIDWNVLQDFQNMKIVRSYGRELNPSNMCDIENQYQYSPEQMLRKAAWNYNAFRIFTPAITEEYESKTNLKERFLGSNPNFINEYYMDLRPIDYVHRAEIISDIDSLGILYWNNAHVLTIPKLEDLNLIRLAVSSIKSVSIFHSQELLDMESRMSHSNPIQLNT